MADFQSSLTPGPLPPEGVLTPDSILPAQYFATLRRELHLEPEELVMFAVLEDAVSCFQNYIFVSCGEKKALFRDAAEWIEGRVGDPLFSFRSVCEILGYDPQYIRNGLMRWKNEALRAKSRGIQPLVKKTRKGHGSKPGRVPKMRPAAA